MAGVDGRDRAVKRLLKFEALEVTEAVLVLRIAVLLLFEKYVVDDPEKAELLPVGLQELFFSDCDRELQKGILKSQHLLN